MDSASFHTQFAAMLRVFHACNNLYLTYQRPKYKSLYWVEKPKKAKGKHDRGPGGGQGHKCTTRRCQLKRDKLESAKAEEDFGWKQKVPYRARDG